MRNNKMSRYYNDYLQHSDEDTLAHFGIPGMKWGQRKIQEHKELSRKIREEDAYYEKAKQREHQRLDKLNAKNNNRNVRGVNDLIGYGFKKYQINQQHKEASAKAREQAANYMKKKYGDSYVKQKNSREVKRAAALVGAMVAGNLLLDAVSKKALRTQAAGIHFRTPSGSGLL